MVQTTELHQYKATTVDTSDVITPIFFAVYYRYLIY